MILYALTLALIIGLGLIQYLRFPNNKAVKLGYLILMGGLLLFISGWRYGIGFDYFTYMELFRNIRGANFSDLMGYQMEPGYLIFIKLLSFLGTNPHMIYIGTSVVIVAIAVAIFYFRSEVPFASLLLFVSLGFFYSGMNLQRYTLAFLIAFLGCFFLQKSRWDYSKENRNRQVILSDLLTNFLPYLAIVLLAASFHKSALIMIPAYFVAKIPLNWYTGAVYAIVTALVCVFGWPLAHLISELFFHGNYSERNLYTSPGGTVHMIIPLLICLATVCLSKTLMQRRKENLYLVNFAIFTAMLGVVAALSVFLATRLLSYFFIFSTLLVPEIIAALRPSQELVLKIKTLSTEAEEMRAQQDSLEDEDERDLSPYREKVLELRKLQTAYKDDRAYYWFAIIFVAIVGILTQYQAYQNGAHRVFPYMSEYPSINRFANGVSPNKPEQMLSYVKHQRSLGEYLMAAASNSNYTVFLSVKGDIGAQKLTPDHLEPLFRFGLDDRLAYQNGKAYLAAGKGDGTAYWNEMGGTDPITANLEIDGKKIELISAPGLTTGYSSIYIDGAEYSNNYAGINVVLYDMDSHQVVDSVTFDVKEGTLLNDMIEPLSIISRKSAYQTPEEAAAQEAAQKNKEARQKKLFPSVSTNPQ